MRAKLTKRLIDSTDPDPQGRDVILWDTACQGFGCRVRASGSKTFLAKVRTDQGRARWLTIGRLGPWTVEGARKEAASIIGQAARGEDPAAERDRDKRASTIADLGDRFLTEYAAHHCRPRTLYEYERIIRLFVKPTLGAVKIPDLDKSHVERLQRELSDRPYQSNRAVDVLSLMVNKAVEWELRPAGSNPCRYVRKFREERRQRFLQGHEFEALGQALTEAERDGTATPAAVGAIRLLMLTGARLSEVLQLEWSHVDLERGTLNLPTSKTGAKVIQLNPAATELLRNTPRLEGNPFVFPGQRPGRPIVNLQKSWRRIRERAGLEDVRLHDLRHSFASVAASSGLSLPIIGRLLGHTQPHTTARYAHLTDQVVKEANEAVGSRIAAAVQPSSK